MIVKHKNNNTTKLDPSSLLMGLKIDTVTLDYYDIQKILSKNSEQLINWLVNLSTSMYKAKPATVTTYVPIDQDNEKLKLEGKSYFCKAFVKNENT
jgi:hypothetical protein